MANEMTVERFIELLKEQYPQAIVLIEEPFRYRGASRVLTPIKLQPTPHGEGVCIICKEHVGGRK